MKWARRGRTGTWEAKTDLLRLMATHVHADGRWVWDVATRVVVFGITEVRGEAHTAAAAKRAATSASELIGR